MSTVVTATITGRSIYNPVIVYISETGYIFLSHIGILSEIKKHIKTKLVYLDDSGSIDRFAAILKRSDLCLSNDSGPRHLAIAVGTPTISIMSRKNHMSWKIYNDEKNIVFQGKQSCEKCSENDCRDIIPGKETFGAECIRTIGVDEVMQQVKAILLI